MNNLKTVCAERQSRMKIKSKNRTTARETRGIAEENSHTKILQHGVGEGKNRVE